MNILLTGGTGCLAQNFVTTMIESNPSMTFTILSTHPTLAMHIYHKYKECMTITDKISENTTTPDILINLAGSPIISGPISLRNYSLIENSRLTYTAHLCQKLKQYNKLPRLFLSASAAGIYREAYETHTENSPYLGGDFIANLAMNWENTVWEGCKTMPTRTVLLRLGNVIAPKSMFFLQMKKAIIRGLGFKIKKPQTFMPWIDISDVLGAIAHIIRTPSIKGPVNLVSPELITFNEFAQSLCEQLHHKIHLKLAPSIFNITHGKLAPAITKNIKVRPKLLIDSGYNFCCPSIETAIADALKM